MALHADEGDPGESRLPEPERKSAADFGPVDPPNAGRRTFLMAVPTAKPIMAAKPLTTLQPPVRTRVDNQVQRGQMTSEAGTPGL